MTDTAVVERTHGGASCTCTRCTGFPVRHGAFLRRLNDADRGEIEELAGRIGELVPDPFDADAPTIVALARTEWRIGRMTAWIAENGETSNGEARSLLKHLDSAERLARDLRARLGLDAASRHDLGLKDAQRRALRSRTFDLSRLDPAVRARAEELAGELEQLVAGVEVVE